MSLKWYVIYDDWNARKIGPYNIFKHSEFHKEVQEHLKKYADDKEKFVKELRASLMYYFWAKAEWEVVVGPWICSTAEKALKIDVYDQVMLNWDVFVDYVWSHRKSGE